MIFLRLGVCYSETVSSLSTVWEPSTIIMIIVLTTSSLKASSDWSLAFDQSILQLWTILTMSTIIMITVRTYQKTCPILETPCCLFHLFLTNCIISKNSRSMFLTLKFILHLLVNLANFGVSKGRPIDYSTPGF